MAGSCKLLILMERMKGTSGPVWIAAQDGYTCWAAYRIIIILAPHNQRVISRDVLRNPKGRRLQMPSNGMNDFKG